ncbi:hypothetical protein GALMADRAFT_229454 [Galerina marginata CBS 339.88]|uniref:Uncharacterized protein n=1 Tax=Galerina marginata (strain CBS 339.88) TaxID=685588 RepID=A0A067SUX9_GALM3|nr:hypothetical protein GALMADRAFT_229454 [Galerina marginata CBS 339.88]
MTTTETQIDMDIANLSCDPTIAVRLAAAATTPSRVPHNAAFSYYSGYGIKEQRNSTSTNHKRESFTETDQRTRSLMDIFAAILSRTPEDKVACALHIHGPEPRPKAQRHNRKTPNGFRPDGAFEFIFAGNSVIDDEALTHLRGIWDIMVQLSRLIHRGKTDSDPASKRSATIGVKEKWAEIKRRIYTFSMPAFRTTFTRNASGLLHWYTAFTLFEQRLSVYQLGKEEEAEKEDEEDDSSDSGSVDSFMFRPNYNRSRVPEIEAKELLGELKSLAEDLADCLVLLNEITGNDDSTILASIPSLMPVREPQRLDAFILKMRKLHRRARIFLLYRNENLIRTWSSRGSTSSDGAQLRHCLEEISRFADDIALLYEFITSDEFLDQSGYALELRQVFDTGAHTKLSTIWPTSEQNWKDLVLHVHMEAGEALRRYEDSHAISIPPANPTQLSVHGELILIEYLNKSHPHVPPSSSTRSGAAYINKSPSSTPFDYIAVSGLSCAPCAQWIKFHNSQESQRDRQIRIRGTNFLYPNDWLVPNFQEEVLGPKVTEQALDDFICFKAHADNTATDFYEWKVKHFRERNHI